jgi:hypothetical protein
MPALAGMSFFSLCFSGLPADLTTAHTTNITIQN